MEDSLPFWHFALVWAFWIVCAIGFAIYFESQTGDR